MLKAPSTASNIKPLEAGTYPGRVLGITDMGLQPMKAYRGEEKQPRHKVAFSYEMSDAFMEDDEGNEDPKRPYVITEILPLYPISSERAKSTQRYTVLDSDLQFGGDFSKLVSLPVNVVIVQNPDNQGKIWNNVANLTSMRAKEKDNLPDLVNSPFVFDLDEPDMEVYEKLYPWLKRIIETNLEFGGSKLEALLKGGKELDDDIPF